MTNIAVTITLARKDVEAILEAIDWMNHGHSDPASMMMPSTESYLALEKQFNEMILRGQFPEALILNGDLLFDYSLLLNWAWREQLIDTDEQLGVLERLSLQADSMVRCAFRSD